ncbi:MAG: hypothetical protein NWE89_13540 [Candidatus Bathyarchaeota archaeon]|nr:hypothetical protein [Candidatus Bathyarchaeota archaeon]
MARRHKLTEDEIQPVMRSLHKALTGIIETHVDSDDAEPLFHVLWRLHHHRPGPPAYPETSITAVVKLLADTMYIYNKKTPNFSVSG